MTRYFGFLSLSLGLGLGGYLLYNQWQLTNHSPSQRFYLSWSKDITELKKAKLLPKQWNNIREVVFITPTPYANEWVQSADQLPISINKSGDYLLEILITDWFSEGKMQVMIQYDLIEIDSGENIWELGRTLTWTAEEPPSTTEQKK